ncbi:uncharacterized protein A1O9_09790 [Exophiala aquamarina CBS 119918]|uniref:Lariat debranching enzyme C-terminal domain-containing protein n=1 Tax=Exophiala aquamarina CBS 119918 TaxID=1182545 RepID=A0A072PEK2_9EURO|nr:uncharacterized protein A1O9_09790 [Exophiala aquamarina CBS 119918]KEF53995.1 hypothetical protein A1O9_09790 [Exophiala aquamarina CBS 119918]
MPLVEELKTGGVRIAVEGCGHGTLHAIYASVEEACRVKGWEGVDLLIIGGDFQAVRNQHDLNVTSMPQKYRRMADFHEYYSGARVAPCLTIFIGGNHEASNHLFELYYGGWVAPEIYYLGAANVLRFGPLRIAGLTGIWKPYDYPKPHFERLPYNQEEVGSIYHVRELDARKLLSLRSQVDIGLSHDWPQGIEMFGDHHWLFKAKSGFYADSKSGKLGSVAAKQCLERLRPPYWFSAHLHTKFAAIVHHGETEGKVDAGAHSAQKIATQSGGSNNHPINKRQSSSSPNIAPANGDQQRVSAWQQFHIQAKKTDSEEKDQIMREKTEQREEEMRTGIRHTPRYTFDETFHKVSAGDALERKVVSTTTQQVSNCTTSDSPESVPNLDGCGFSRPNKRQRFGSPNTQDGENVATRSAPQNSQVDGAGANVTSTTAGVTADAIANPDAIDIDMSEEEDQEVEDDDDDDTKAKENGKDTAPSARPISATQPLPVNVSRTQANLRDVCLSISEESEDGGVKLNPQAPNFTPSLPPTLSLALNGPTSKESLASSGRSSDSDFNHEATSFQPKTSTASLNTFNTAPKSPVEPPTKAKGTQNEDNEVSEEMRAQLAALSSNFTQGKEVKPSAALPFPAEITNKTTNFLALGKCEPYQEFLQLLEINSITSPEEPIRRPIKLSYDPEWLAIQRVFAPELTLGGHAYDKIPTHRGETYYRELILKEQEWITEHVVKAGRLEIPENFSITAPVYDPQLNVGPHEMPREVTNPQTTAFCDLIGIQNKFDITEEERDARMMRGPKPESAGWIASRERRGGHGGHHGRGGARGGGAGGSSHRGGGGRGGARGGRGGRGGGRGW